MTTPPPDIQALLAKHKSLKYNESKNKVICQLTKHEMPPALGAIESYVKGKKYQKAAEKTFDFNQYKPHIVPSSKRQHLHELFCFLTLRHVARTQQAVERHVSGKRYKRALARWTKCQETGEKFIPRGGRRKNAGGSDSDSIRSGGAPNWSDDSAGEDDADEDDLEDLYPAEVFGGDSDDEGDASEAEENTPPPKTTTAKTRVKTDASDDSSDYDMDVMDEEADSASDTNIPVPNSTAEPKKLGKKKKKMKENGETVLDSNKKKKGAKSMKREATADTDGPKLKKKKLKN